jgi:hypothetical protein
MHGAGEKRRLPAYRFLNEVPLTVESSAAQQVKWVELVLWVEEGIITFCTTLVTNHLITKETEEALVEPGRCRRKIENADVSPSKSKRYHSKHNVGPSKQHFPRRCYA